MSLAREALRLCTVHALRGKTVVGDKVRDSEQGSADDYAENKPAPEVLVYTDDGSFGRNGRELFAGGVTDLVIEIVMTQKMRIKLEETGEDGWAWESPPTDAAMEFTLGIITRQIIVALMDGTDPWAELWRRLSQSIGECKDRRGSSMRDGVRFCGRQLTLPVELIGDPKPGTAPGPVWTGFLALLDGSADASLQAVAPVWRALVEGKELDLPDWQILRAGYGLTADEARAMQIAPPAAAEATSPNITEVITDTAPTAPEQN